jgi:hypothetical protein
MLAALAEKTQMIFFECTGTTRLLHFDRTVGAQPSMLYETKDIADHGRRRLWTAAKSWSNVERTLRDAMRTAGERRFAAPCAP